MFVLHNTTTGEFLALPEVPRVGAEMRVGARRSFEWTELDHALRFADADGAHRTAASLPEFQTVRVLTLAQAWAL